MMGRLRQLDLWTIHVAEYCLSILHRWTGIRPSQVYRLSCLLTAAAWIAQRYEDTAGRPYPFFQIFLDTGAALGFAFTCVMAPWMHDADVIRDMRSGCQNRNKLSGFYFRAFWWVFLIIDTFCFRGARPYMALLEIASLVTNILAACDEFPPCAGKIRDWARSLGKMRLLQPIKLSGLDNPSGDCS